MTDDGETAAVGGADEAPTPPGPYEPTSSLGELIQRISDAEGARYRAEGEIARGGMGSILRVHDETLRRDIAMKVVLDAKGRPQLRDTEGSLTPIVRRFLEEAQVTAQLDHPGVVPVHELGLDAEGRLFFTMKLVKGKTLGEVFELVWQQSDDWTTTRAVQVFIRICDTLAFAHSKGVIHRDLKPANVMVGSFGEVYVMDWGLAKALGAGAEPDDVGVTPSSMVRTDRLSEVREAQAEQLTMAGSVIGTPSYMPLEQALGHLDQLDARSDVYAVGAMLYHLLGRRAPYTDPGEKRTPKDVLMRVIAEPPEPLRELAPTLPPEIVAIVGKAMARDPADRYASAGVLARELRHFIEGRVVSTYRTGALVELKKWIGRNRAVAGMAALAFVLLVGGLITSIRLGVEAGRQREAAEVERDVARREAYKAALAAALADIDRNELRSARARLEKYEQAFGRPDTWEWRHVASRLDQSAAQYEGGLVGFDPQDGRLLLVDEQGQLTAVDELGEAEALTRLPYEDIRLDFGLSPDGRYVLCRSGPDRIAVFDRNTNETIYEAGFKLPLKKELRWAFVRRPARLLYIDAARGLLVVDLARGVVTGRIPFKRSSGGMAVSPDGAWLAMEPGDARSVYLYDLDTLERRGTAHADSATCAAFSPDGNTLVVGFQTRLWMTDLRQSPLRSSANATLHTQPARDLVFSPDGGWVASAAADRMIGLHRFENGVLKHVRTFYGHLHTPERLAVSPDGRLLASQSRKGGIRLWDVSDIDQPGPRVLTGHAKWVNPVAFTPDDRRIVSGGWDGEVDEPGCLRVWDAASGAPIVGLGSSHQVVTSLGIAPDGRRALAAGTRSRRRVHEGALFYDLDTGAPVTELPRKLGRRGAALSPDGSRALLTAGSRPHETDPEVGVAHLVDAGSGDVVTTFTHRGWSQGRGLAFSPDGRWIATTPYATQLRLWRADTFEAAVDLVGHTGFVYGIAFSPDGRRVATASFDSTARVWDIATGAELAVLRGHEDDVLDVVYSPDGTRILTSSKDRRIRVWDAQTFDDIVTLTGHEAYVFSLDFSSEGERLVSGSGDGTVRIWETEPISVRYRARFERLRLVEALRSKVQALFDELSDASQVVQRLREDETLTGRRLEIALQIALRMAAGG